MCKSEVPKPSEGELAILHVLWDRGPSTVREVHERFGAVRKAGTVYLHLTADRPWEGHVVFDQQRHKLLMHLPLDYTRINQFPEWFIVQSDRRYQVKLGSNHSQKKTGAQLAKGLPVKLQAGQALVVEVNYPE